MPNGEMRRGNFGQVSPTILLLPLLLLRPSPSLRPHLQVSASRNMSNHVSRPHKERGSGGLEPRRFLIAGTGTGLQRQGPQMLSTPSSCPTSAESLPRNGCWPARIFLKKSRKPWMSGSDGDNDALVLLKACGDSAATWAP